MRAECGHVFCKPCVLDYINTVQPNKPLAGGEDDDAGGDDDDDDDDEGEGRKKKKKQPKKPKAKAARKDEIAACPACGEPLTIDFDAAETTPSYRQSFASSSSSSSAPVQRKRKTILDKINLGMFQSSTKLEALMEEVSIMQAQELGNVQTQNTVPVLSQCPISVS